MGWDCSSWFFTGVDDTYLKVTFLYSFFRSLAVEVVNTNVKYAMLIKVDPGPTLSGTMSPSCTYRAIAFDAGP